MHFRRLIWHWGSHCKLKASLARERKRKGEREREVSYSLTAYSTVIHALSTLCTHLVHASKTLELTETSCYSVGKAMSYLLYPGVLQQHDHTSRILDFETVVSQRTISLRWSDNLHAVKERLNFLYVFVILGYPVEPRSAYARFCS